MKIRLVLVSSIALLFLFSCGGGDRQTCTVEEIDGVRHVHNHAPLQGDTPKVKLEFVQKIGNLESEDENYMLFMPFEAHYDSEGNILVFDGGNDRIQKYDPDGKYLLSIGRSGQGPGEFHRASTFLIDDRDNVYVVERKIHQFDKAGNYIDSFLPMTSTWEIQHGDQFGVICPVSGLTNKKDEFTDEELALVLIKDREGNVLNMVGRKRIFDDFYLRQRGNGFSCTIDEENNLYFTFSSQNRIEKYSPAGELLLRITRDLPFPESERVIEYTRVNGQKGRYYNEFSRAIGIDGKGRIWVQSYTRNLTDEERKTRNIVDIEKLFAFEIYDADGILLTRIPCDFGFNRFLTELHSDRLLVTDPGEEMAVYEYRIVEVQ